MLNYRYLIIGLGLIILPFAVVYLDAVLDISEGANIGAGLLGIITVPIGIALIVIQFTKSKK